MSDFQGLRYLCHFSDYNLVILCISYKKLCPIKIDNGLSVGNLELQMNAILNFL